MPKNPHMDSEIRGLQTNVVYAGTNQAKVQQLIDLVEQEHTQQHRGHLDMMSPLAQRQLVAELTALKAAITNA